MQIKYIDTTSFRERLYAERSNNAAIDRNDHGLRNRCTSATGGRNCEENVQTKRQLAEKINSRL